MGDCGASRAAAGPRARFARDRRTRPGRSPRRSAEATRGSSRRPRIGRRRAGRCRPCGRPPGCSRDRWRRVGSPPSRPACERSSSSPRARSGQLDRGEHGRVPGPEVLRRVVAAGDRLQVLVDLRGLDVGPAAATRPIGEQLVAAAVAILERLDRRYHQRVGDLLLVVERALRLVAEAGDRAADLDVLAPQGREAEGLVLLRVALAADPEEAEVEQLHRTGQDPVSDEAAPGEVGAGALAHRRQRPREGLHLGELLAVARLAPVVVVEVLLAARRIDPVAWMWPFGWGQIQTSFHAGGIASSRIRSITSRSTIRSPSASS